MDFAFLTMKTGSLQKTLSSPTPPPTSPSTTPKINTLVLCCLRSPCVSARHIHGREMFNDAPKLHKQRHAMIRSCVVLLNTSIAYRRNKSSFRYCTLPKKKSPQQHTILVGFNIFVDELLCILLVILKDVKLFVARYCDL